MLARIPRHLTYANVVSTLCLFILLGGSAFAAVRLSKNSVRSKHIKNGQVQNVDLGSGAVDGSKVADGSLARADFASDALGDLLSGDEADARFLPKGGTAADSSRLGGAGPADYVKGDGRTYVASGRASTRNDGESQSVVTLPGVGELRLNCLFQSSGGQDGANFFWEAQAPQETWWWHKGEVNRATLGQGVASAAITPPAINDPYVVKLTAATSGGAIATVTASVLLDEGGVGLGDEGCPFAATGIRHPG